MPEIEEYHYQGSLQDNPKKKIERLITEFGPRKLSGFVLTLFLAITLPVTLLVVQQRQEFRQRAAENISPTLKRPIFGTFVDSYKFTGVTTPQAKKLILDHAKIIYPDGMNYACDPVGWENPQFLLDQPAMYFGKDISQINNVNAVIRNPEVLQKGIIARGYIWNSREGNNPRPSKLPQNVSNPLFGQAVKKVEIECTKNSINAFKDRISNWRIANEIFEDNGSRRLSWHTNRPVDITHKLTAAREVDPEAKLYIDDYGAEEINSKSTGILNYMKQLRQQGYPIHGMGFQGHFSLNNPPNMQSIKDNIQRFKREGFEVAFTEVDVAIDGVSGTEDEKRSRQKDTYKNIAQICKDFSNCTLFMIYGFDDNNSWLGTQAKAHPFDTTYQPKPAWYGINEILNIVHQTFSDVLPGTFGFAELENFVLKQAEDGSKLSGCGSADVNGRQPFCPTNTVNRAEMAKFMIVAMQQSVSSVASAFSDMAGYEWALKYAMRMKELQITQGCGDGTTYCPGEAVNRGAMVTFIGRAFPEYAAYTPPSTPSFTDVTPSSGELYKAVEFAKFKGITQGSPAGCSGTGNTFCPGNNVSRIEMAVFLMRAFPSATTYGQQSEQQIVPSSTPRPTGVATPTPTPASLTPTPALISCQRCSNTLGCAMSSFQSTSNSCVTPVGVVTYTASSSCPYITGGSDNTRCANNCSRCSNSKGCTRAYFQGSDSSCVNPIASTISYVKDMSCPSIAGVDNTNCQ